MPDPVDVARLREFSDGSAEGLQQLIDLFLAHMHESAEALRPAVADLRAEEIRILAHKAAGTAGACGARDLARLLVTLEKLGANRELQRTAPVLEEIEQELARLRAFLAALVESTWKPSRDLKLE
jgi:HPt (histidine-containing phosphotransfer) domain-containing protein